MRNKETYYAVMRGASASEINEWTDVEARIIAAFNALKEYDLKLLLCDANERTICAQLAVYLRMAFPGYDVDVEYNRHGMDPKRVEVDPEGNEMLVYPDVIVHRRATDELNLLVMEVKKSTNLESRSHDRRKLKCCVDEFAYAFAVLVDIPVGAALSGQLKTGHSWTPQIRPFPASRDGS